MEWQTNPKKTLLFTWLKNVSDYAHTKTSAPVIIAPFFNLWQPADLVGDWYNELFTVATNLDAVYPQDGVGITLKDPNYHIPLYFQKIKTACDNNGVIFGATIESFAQQTGWPIDGVSFSAISTSISSLKTQIWNADNAGATDLIQFEWSYMQNGITPSATNLNNDYTTYANDKCTVTTIEHQSENNYSTQEMNTVSIFPNPTTGVIEINTSNEINVNEIGLYSIIGNSILDNNMVQQLSPNMIRIDLTPFPSGIYCLTLGSSSSIINKQ